MGFFSRFLGADSPDVSDATDEKGMSAGAGSVSSLDVNALVAPKPTAEPAAPVDAADPATTEELKPKVIDALKTVFDPEIPVDIYELGLIYDIRASRERHVHVTMTLTSPACPSAQQLPSEVRFKVKALEGVSDASVEVVWEPPWDKDRMSETARLQLGFF